MMEVALVRPMIVTIAAVAIDAKKGGAGGSGGGKPDAGEDSVGNCDSGENVDTDSGGAHLKMLTKVYVVTIRHDSNDKLYTDNGGPRGGNDSCGGGDDNGDESDDKGSVGDNNKGGRANGGCDDECGDSNDMQCQRLLRLKR